MNHLRDGYELALSVVYLLFWSIWELTLAHTLRNYEGRCEFCRRDIGDGHEPGCPYTRVGED